MGGHLLANTVMQHTVRLEQTTFKVRVHCDALLVYGCRYEYIVKVHSCHARKSGKSYEYIMIHHFPGLLLLGSGLLPALSCSLVLNDMFCYTH